MFFFLGGIMCTSTFSIFQSTISAKFSKLLRSSNMDPQAGLFAPRPQRNLIASTRPCRT